MKSRTAQLLAAAATATKAQRARRKAIVRLLLRAAPSAEVDAAVFYLSRGSLPQRLWNND